MQKNHISYAQAKGASDGHLPYPVAPIAKANYFIEDLENDFPLNIPLNVAASLIRIQAVGGNVYLKFGEDVGNGSSSHGTSKLTLAVNPSDLDDDSITIGAKEYVFKSEIARKAQATLVLTGVITPGKHAESVVTANTIVDGSQITIGTRTYTFKTDLSTGPTVADEVLIGGSDDVALDNLKLAINAGLGIGTNYSTGTVVHAQVVATDNAATTQKVIARVPGTAANTLATTSLNGTLSWPDTTLGGGTGASNPGVASETVTINTKVYSFVDVLSETNGAAAIINQVLFGADSAAALDNLKLAINGGATEGTNYSTGTEQPVGIEATDNANDSQVVLALAAGVAGNSLAVTAAGAAMSWEFDSAPTATLDGGYDDDGKTVVIGNAAADTQNNLRAAINGGAGAGTLYSTALTANEDVWMDAFETNVAEAIAREVGAVGNDIATTSDFTSGSNSWDQVKTAGGADAGSFDALIIAGQMLEFGVDESVSVISIRSNAATGVDVVLIEY